MHFGQFVRRVREARGLDLRTFAAQTGVDATTISRIENARAQATLKTVIHICEGVGVTLTELLQVLLEKHVVGLEQQPLIEGTVIPTRQDAETLMAYFRQHRHTCFHFLARVLNQIAFHGGFFVPMDAGGEAHLFVPEDIQKLLLPLPLYQFELQYPTGLSAASIWNIYRSGGVLSLTDVGAYVKRVRRERQVTLLGLEDSVKIPASVLSQLETGAIERIRFIDVLTLDAQLVQDGKIIAMYWHTSKFNDGLVRGAQLNHAERSRGFTPSEAEQELQIITLFTIICRWLQVLNGEETAWIHELRTQLQHIQVQTSVTANTHPL